MKFLFTVFFLCFIWQAGFSQDINGYFIKANGDTIPSQIKIPKAVFGGINEEHLFAKVEVVDSLGGAVYKPGEIKSFAFTYKNQEYNFYSKPVRKYNFNYKATNDTLFRFMTVFSKGKNATGYSYYASGYGNTSPHVMYSFERGIDSAYLYLHNYGGLKEMHAALADFYRHVPAITGALSNKFVSRRKVQQDIQAVIEALNQ